MKGHAFRKLSRTSAHRNHLLRNLVTSLFHHERISTTVAKAREAQREAEKIITKAKRASSSTQLTTTTRAPSEQWAKATGYVFARSETAPILQQLALRYANRPGGYTRLHLHGNRPGDHAPRALLELVDNDKGDLRFEMTARAIGRAIYLAGLRKKTTPAAINALSVPNPEADGRFSASTRLYISKALKNQAGGEEQVQKRKQLLLAKADEHLRRLQAEGIIDSTAGLSTEASGSSSSSSNSSHSISNKSSNSANPAWRRTNQALIDTKSWQDNQPRGRMLTPPRVGTPLVAGMNPADRPGGDQIYQPKPLAGSRGRNSVVRLAKGVFAKRQGIPRFTPKSFKSAAVPSPTRPAARA